MYTKNRAPVVFAAFIFLGGFLCAQQRSGAYNIAGRIDEGIALYEQGRFSQAVQNLRAVVRDAQSGEERAEALFWIAITELAAGEYENAIYDMDDMRRADPSNIRVLEAPYHKGRAFFSLKRYTDAIRCFEEYEKSIRIDGRYLNSVRYDVIAGASPEDLQIEYNKKASAIYWIGECYYAMEDYERSLSYYSIIVEQYMKSHKYESSMNRISLIKQKKVENELREEIRALVKPAETAQGPFTGGPTYDEAILAYQNRIAPYLMMQAISEEEKKQSAAAPPVSAIAPASIPQASVKEEPKKTDHEVTKRLLAIKTSALEIMDRLLYTLNAYEALETSRWSP
ncbi:MAG: tetratricopeptide repeat protein [Spirochaetaceae bacterium]|jgi:tetratricopeptide (TPR) repeat protein|nr:tetratricopeptide repeat protein [Spirochaetaceae bacterium]